MLNVNVAIQVPLHRVFTYSVPPELANLAIPGMRVAVPFRRKEKIGYITDINVETPSEFKTKDIISIPDDKPTFTKSIMELLHWISDYYCSPIGEVFAAATPNLLNRASELNKKRRKPIALNSYKDFHKNEKIKLNLEQQEIWNDIEDLIDKKRFSPALLHGVTGSGKTEIYLRAIEKVISEGKQAILLVPEISLAPQLAGRVISYFEEDVSIYHSGLTDTQRLNQWQQMKEGKTKIVVGTRSALFAPFDNLGIIIIDEEHDYSYKQEESPRYNARDAAMMRGKLEKVPVLLGSATPSFESLSNAKLDKYSYFNLSERHAEASMPEIKIVDMRKEPKSKLINPHLSIELLSNIETEVKNGNQVLLFINRRGYSNFIICEDCGYIPNCPNCNISLTYHKNSHRLACHYCDYGIPVKAICPECGGGNLNPVGKGTERIEEIIREIIPTARIARLDRDTVTSDKKRLEILEKMHKGELDILIGTQMITKGHDFPDVTLVGIISADQSIHFPDFRSSERTFQLLTQVSGRAGRAKKKGKVIVQTYSPDHISISTSSNNKLDEFLEEELSLRKELSYPPFSRLANIKITGNRENLVANSSKGLAEILKEAIGKHTNMRLLGPAPAPLALLKGKTRWQMLIKSKSAKNLASTLAIFKQHIDQNPISGISISIDVDPISTM